MKNLIIYGTKFGSTKECAQILSEKIPETTVIDAKDYMTIKDLKSYDNIIIGSNIIAERLNKYVVKFIKKNKEILSAKKVFGYIVAGADETKQNYTGKMAKLINGPVIFAGGVYDASKAKGISKFFISKIVESKAKKNEPLPKLKIDKLDELASLITK
jgi:menaquinone-dependent protoporphyrinogen oxidase